MRAILASMMLGLAIGVPAPPPPDPPDPSGTWGCYYADGEIAAWIVVIQPAGRGGYSTTWQDGSGTTRYTGTMRWDADRASFIEHWRGVGETTAHPLEWEWTDGTGGIEAVGRNLNLRKS
jgi:hypothetical protein